MDRPTALITGGNAGIGKAAARQLLERGWEVVITSRRPRAGEATVDALQRHGPVSWQPLDLARLDSVRECAARLAADRGRLDVLINNAGTVRSRRELSPDGFEVTFQTNHLGPFLLTHLLRPALAASDAPRIVNVGSAMHQRSHGLDFDDLQMARGYGPLRAYADTKLANVYFTQELARRWPEVVSNAVHPGGVRTELGGGGELRPPGRWVWWFMKRFLRSPASGAAPVVRLAADDLEGATGAYFHRFKRPALRGPAADDAAARRLWEASESLLGI
jgi:NAD(P)-dependent dehydrogenase (short-subunit alcohol dehydrogenase family)